MESEDDGLRQRWAEEWHALGSAPLSPSEMKEWMQARKAILDRLQQAREKKTIIRIAGARVQCCRSDQRTIDRGRIGTSRGEQVAASPPQGRDGFAKRSPNRGAP